GGRGGGFKPAQRGSVGREGGDVVDEAGGVVVIEAGAEPVDGQSVLGPCARADGGWLPVPGRRLHQQAAARAGGVAQVVDDRDGDGKRDAFLDPQDYHRGRREQGKG